MIPWEVMGGELEDSNAICGGCHDTFSGNHSGFNTDIGGESSYGGIGL